MRTVNKREFDEIINQQVEWQGAAFIFKQWGSKGSNLLSLSLRN